MSVKDIAFLKILFLYPICSNLFLDNELFVNFSTTLFVKISKWYFDIREFPILRIFGNRVVWFLIMSYLSNFPQPNLSTFPQLYLSNFQKYNSIFEMFGNRGVWFLIMSYLSCTGRFPRGETSILIDGWIQRGRK